MSKPYPTYKDSGVEWQGEVPSHWKSAQLKRYMKLRYGDALAADSREEGEVAVFGSNGIVGLHSRANTAQPAIIVGRKGSFGKIVWAESGGFVIDTAYSIDCQTTGQLLRWVYYMLQLLGLDRFSQDTGVPGLARERAHGLEIVVPPIEEQSAIAAFLDHETAKIDALVEEQRRLIALLKEKRQAVISHAVTKGLNPNAPMKDSGIEWLGEVPEHWTVMPIRYSAKLESGHTPNRSRADWWENCTVPWFSLADVWQIRRGHADYIYETNEKVSEIGLANSSARLLPKGTVMLSRTASVGYSAIMGVDMATTQDFANWVCGDDLEPEFLLFVFRGMTKEFDRLMMGSTHNTIYMPDIVMFRFARPPLDEQAKIVSFIRKQAAQIDNLIATAEKVVALSVERRTALISTAITGKIDVRPSAEIISLPVDRARVRGLVATEIIERMGSHNTFGRVKLQKLAYLAETHVGVSELGGNYLRMAAGPLDSDMVNEMEREASLICGVTIEQPGGARTAVVYRTTGRKGRHSVELSKFLGPERSRKLNRLISDLKDKSTRSTEAIATLYAVWNNALIDGKTPSDDDIVYDFLNDWHPEKRDKFKNLGELHTWLDWMRRHGLVPAGNGSKVHPSQLLI